MILEVTAVPYTENHRGGGESFPWYLSQQLRKLEPTILAYAQEADCPNPPSDHFVLPALFLDFPPTFSRHNPIPTSRTIRIARSFLRAHSKELDFIHVHNLRTAMATMWLALAHRQQTNSKFRILLTDHGSRWFPFPYRTAPWADFFLPVSSASRVELQRYARRPSWVLPVGVPPDYPGLSLPRKSYSERPIDLLFFGRFVEFKRPHLFLRLVSDLIEQVNPSLRAVLMGSRVDARYWSHIEREIIRQDLGERLRIVLNPSTEEAASLLGKAKLNVLLSNQAPKAGTGRTPSELAPTTVMEAGACGTPTLASTFRGVGDVVNSGQTGLIVDTHQWPAVVQTATQILRDESGWEELSRAVWGFVRRERTYDRIAGNLHALLRDLKERQT